MPARSPHPHCREWDSDATVCSPLVIDAEGGHAIRGDFGLSEVAKFGISEDTASHDVHEDNVGDREHRSVCDGNGADVEHNHGHYTRCHSCPAGNKIYMSAPDAVNARYKIRTSSMLVHLEGVLWRTSANTLHMQES